MIDLGHGILPDQVLLGNLGAEVAGERAHVTVQKLEPGTAEGVLQLREILEEATRDLLVLGVGTQCKIARQHCRLALLAGVEGVGDVGLGTLGHPLPGTARALLLLPLVVEERGEVAIAPLGRGGGPYNLEARGDGIAGAALAVLALPAKALLVDLGTGGGGAAVAVRGSTVGLAEGVAASNEGDSLVVVHGHAAEGGADVPRGGEGVRDAVGTDRVDIDKTHVGGAHGLLELTVMNVGVLGPVALHGPGGLELLEDLGVAGVIALGEHGGLAAPVDGLVGLPGVGAAAGKAEWLEAHGLEGDVAGEQHEVGPGDLVAILLLDGPEQAARLVEVAVVGPAVEGLEALLAVAAAAAAVEDTVGAGGVPGHADHQAAVVAVVGGPPVLGVCHEGVEVLLEGGIVELLEGLGVVKVLVVGVGRGRVHAQDIEA